MCWIDLEFLRARQAVHEGSSVAYELYLETDGAVLDGRASVGPVAPEKKKLQVQVESLQNKLLEDLLKRVEILEKQKIKTDYELDRIHKSVAFLQSGLQEPR